MFLKQPSSIGPEVSNEVRKGEFWAWQKFRIKGYLFLGSKHLQNTRCPDQHAEALLPHGTL